MLRVLSISTLFPNPRRPTFGVFVGNQMRAVAALGEVELAMLNPIGLPPWPLSLSGAYRQARSVPSRSELGGIEVRHPRFTLVPRFGGDSNPGRVARALLPLARRLHDERPFDLVDAQFFFPDGPAAAILAHELGLPLTIKARGSDIHFWSRRPGALAQLLRAADRAAGLLAVSQALRRDMIALGMAGDKIAVHYTGVDHGRFRPVDRKRARAQLHGLPAEGPLLVTTGALMPRKGQHLVIAALPALPGTHLALAGGGTAGDEARLRRLVASLGLGERVHFLGIVSHAELPGLLAAADAMVLPSANEGLANAWVEALACGTPLVIPDVGGAREVIRDASAGRIVERTPDAIAAAVRELLADPPVQAEVAANAARFSWEENARQLAAFWRRAADR